MNTYQPLGKGRGELLLRKRRQSWLLGLGPLLQLFGR